MPRYAYRCNSCNAEFLTVHGADERLETCTECMTSGALTKLLTKPSYGIKKKSIKKVGKITEDFIEESKRALEKQRKELDIQR